MKTLYKECPLVGELPLFLCNPEMNQYKDMLEQHMKVCPDCRTFPEGKELMRGLTLEHLLAHGDPIDTPHPPISNLRGYADYAITRGAVREAGERPKKMSKGYSEIRKHILKCDACSSIVATSIKIKSKMPTLSYFEKLLTSAEAHVANLPKR